LQDPFLASTLSWTVSTGYVAEFILSLSKGSYSAGELRNS